MLNSDSREALELLNGVEVDSLKYEGCIGIKGDKVIRDGEYIDTIDTNAKLETIWNEYMDTEVKDDELLHDTLENL